MSAVPLAICKRDSGRFAQHRRIDKESVTKSRPWRVLPTTAPWLADSFLRLQSHRP